MLQADRKKLARRLAGNRGGAVLDAIGWTCVILAGGFLLLMVLDTMHLIGHGGGREKARRINCAGNLKQIGLALIIYAGDDEEEGMFPSGTQFGLLHRKNYLVNGKVYTCPSCAKPSEEAGNSNYVYLGQGLADTHADPETVIIAHDRLGNHATWVNCLYLDGHVRGHKSLAETWNEFRLEREAAGERILNRPDGTPIGVAGVLPTYQVLDQ